MVKLTIHWRYIGQHIQNEVQSIIIFCKIHKHINVDTLILCTNISIQTQIQSRFSGIITPEQEIYITNFRRQGRPGESIENNAQTYHT